KPKLPGGQDRSIRSERRKPPPRGVVPPGKVAIIVGGRIKYIDRPGHDGQQAMESPAAPAATPAPKKPKPKRPAAKIDAKYLAAGRELRDRYLEQFNSGLVL